MGDKLTVVAELHDFERLLRLPAAPAVHRVVVDAYSVTAKEVLLPLVRTLRNCSVEDAAALLNAPAVHAPRRTDVRRSAKLLEQMEREKVTARN